MKGNRFSVAFFHVALLRLKSSYRTSTLRHAVEMPEFRFLSLFPVTGTFLSINLSANICLPFKSLLRAYFDFRTKTQRPSPPLHPKVRRRTSLNTPLKDLFFARKSYRFYVPKMSLKNANGCSVCAWLLTSGGLRLTLRLRRNVTRSLRSRAPTKRTHFLRQIDRLTTQFFIAQMHRKQETRLLDEKRGGERSRPR